MQCQYLNKIIIDFFISMFYYNNEMCSHKQFNCYLSETINCFSRRLHMTFREIEIILEANSWILVREGILTNQYWKVGISYTITVPKCSEKKVPDSIVEDLEKKGLFRNR